MPAEGLGQGRHLDGVSQPGAGAVGLHVPEGVGVDARPLQGRTDHRRLTLDAGRGVAHLGGSVVVDRRGADHRVDGIARGERVVESAQHHHRGTVAPDRARGVGVEGPAAAVR